MSAPTAQLTLPDGAAWWPPEPTDPDQRSVLAALRDGSLRTRFDLAQRTGLPDRTVRAAIAALRLAGWPICASSGHAGYCLTFESSAIELLEADLRARALSALKARAALRRIRQRRAA